MEKLQTVKGTHDLLERDFLLIDEIIKISEKVCRGYNYEKISTPIIEFSDLFSKTLGQVSDIVQKEMYNFVDQGGEKITLRPEGTAPVARALISNSLYENISQRFFYSGPMFRREKPQAGRLRQFHQFGIEIFNQPSFFCDVEVILIAKTILELLGIYKMVRLEINTLGNPESRKKYKEKLYNFFLRNEKKLSKDSQIRLKINPLRILDSKDKLDKEIIVNAPKIVDSLDGDSIEFYENLKKALKKLKIEYYENQSLVRGLDYYNHTAFEFLSSEKSGQNAILAGGRYDGLVKSIGGRDICGVGWAAGIERIKIMISDVLEIKRKKIISIFSTSDNLNYEVFRILKNFDIIENISFNFIESGSLKKKFSKANKLKSIACIILGEDELQDQKIIWKDFISGQQELVEINNLNIFLKRKFL